MRIIGRYLAVMGAYAVALALVYLFGRLFSQFFIWYADDPVYQVLNWIQKNYAFFMAAGMIIITVAFMWLPYRDIGRIIGATRALSEDAQTPVVLPKHLSEIEEELNDIRIRSLYNERMMREAEQTKDDLIVYLAHDLKTPLTSVIGYLSLLEENPDLPAEQRAKYAQIAYDKALRLEDLINEFFDIARYSFAQPQLEYATVDLALMMRQILSEFEPQLQEKELRWQTDLPAHYEYLCDPDKLERMIDNLLRNAVHYSYAKTPIHVQMWETEQMVMIRIINRGPTIPKEQLSHLFEQFYRLDSARETRQGGAGLGLAIARQIATLHQGTITADSRDETVIFTVYLPKQAHTQKTEQLPQA